MKIEYLKDNLLFPERRKRGAGSRLVREAERCFMFNGFRSLRVYGARPRFFEKLEWIVAESVTCNHDPIVVLEKRFQSNKPAA